MQILFNNIIFFTSISISKQKINTISEIKSLAWIYVGLGQSDDENMEEPELSNARKDTSKITKPDGSKTLLHLPLFPNTNLTFPMFANNYLILAAVANKN